MMTIIPPAVLVLFASPYVNMSVSPTFIAAYSAATHAALFDPLE